MKIETGGKNIYEGPLNSRTLDSYISLCSLEMKETQEVTFTLTVPKELDNQYTLNNCKVRWVFTVGDGPEIVDAAKTGDALFEEVILFLIMGMGAAGCIFGILFLRISRTRGGKW